MHPLLVFLTEAPFSPVEFYQRCADDGLDRAQRAKVVDYGLRMTAWVQNQAHRTYGQGLATLTDVKGRPMEIGYSQRVDYVRERLGISDAMAKQLACVARRCRVLPLIDTAWSEGKLSYSKVRVLAGGLKPDEEAEWCVRAQKMTVRALTSALKKLRADDPFDTVPDDVPDLAKDDVPEKGRFLTGMFTPFQASLVHRAIERARRMLGSDAPESACLEVWLAEFLARVPVDNLEPVPACEPRVNRSAAREALLENRHRQWEDLDWSTIEADLSEELQIPEDARAEVVDEVLTCMRMVAQHSEAWQLRLLRLLEESSLWKDLKFDSLSHYARERLGMSGSSARSQAELDHEMGLWPELHDAFRQGAVSQCQARELLKVRNIETGPAWIEHAGSVTVRQLKDDVKAALERPGLSPWPPTHRPQPMAQLGNAVVGVALRVALALVGLSVPLTGFQTCTRLQPVREPLRLDEPAVRFKVWLPAGLEEMYRNALATIDRLSGSPTTTAQALEVLSFLYLEESEEEARLEARKHPILERDGWRCSCPVCTRRSMLESHHIVWVSRGGDNSPANQASLCYPHHRQGIHEGHVKLTGKAPQGLTWVLGARNSKPHMVIEGRRIVKR